MAVTRKPANGRLQMVYSDNLASLRFSGINPTVTPHNLNTVISQLKSLQTVNATHGYLIVETELEAN